MQFLKVLQLPLGLHQPLQPPDICGSRRAAASPMLWAFTRTTVSFKAFSRSSGVVSSRIFVWNREAASRCSSSSVK